MRNLALLIPMFNAVETPLMHTRTPRSPHAIRPTHQTAGHARRAAATGAYHLNSPQEACKSRLCKPATPARMQRRRAAAAARPPPGGARLGLRTRTTTCACRRLTILGSHGRAPANAHAIDNIYRVFQSGQGPGAWPAMLNALVAAACARVRAAPCWSGQAAARAGGCGGARAQRSQRRSRGRPPTAPRQALELLSTRRRLRTAIASATHSLLLPLRARPAPPCSVTTRCKGLNGQHALYGPSCRCSRPDDARARTRPHTITQPHTPDSCIQAQPLECGCPRGELGRHSGAGATLPAHPEPTPPTRSCGLPQYRATAPAAPPSEGYGASHS